ncbi:unnamed protein product [Chrysoparadoxa australica]|tara:strand:- start:739 stop:1086 length:348 start_codon:yes stop_codon:yes gene_type:complete
MTSLIDVIFLLLLFFMLSSTFTRFAEVDLAAAGAGTSAGTDRPVFVTLGMQALRVNGSDAALEDLSDSLAAHRDGDGPLGVLVSLGGDVTAQRLTDLLSVLREIADLQVTVLEAT